MKKTEKKKKVKAEVKEFVSKYPPIDLNFKVPEIKLNIQLNQLATEYKSITQLVPINVTLSYVSELINIKNNNCCKNIKLYILDKDNKLQTLKPYLDNTFKELIEKKLTSEDSMSIYYTYDAVENPLLLSGYY